MGHDLITNEQKSRILELAIKAVDADMTPAESNELEGYIASSKALADYYSLCMKMHLSMLECQVSPRSLTQPDSPVFDDALWQALAIHEKNAPEIEVPHVRPPRELIQKVVLPERLPRKVSKFSLVSAVLSAAALLFLVLYAHYGPRPGGPEVATLTDSINAVWSLNGDAGPVKGTRLAAERASRVLQSGLIELRFDTNARVVIEAPAEFQILDEQQIRLQYGKIYAVVPEEAIGFTVQTQTARVIDLGTEFGVQANIDGNTELHVIRGRTSLIAGGKHPRTSLEVTAGQAKQISAGTMTVSDIPCQEQGFVRSIDSEHNFAYKGQRQVLLGDIVGGGNGFGTGKPHWGIDPVSGRLLEEAMGMQKGPNTFRLAPSEDCIDGVFIPDGRTLQTVSSQGHLFRECPPTEGACFNKITYLQQDLNSRGTRGTGDGFLGRSIMTMHANMGITYDLQAIRGRLPETAKVVRFQTKLGIENEVPRKETSNADFWILVDGQLRYQKEQVKAGDLDAVDLELTDGDRFLTLVVTDGQDPEVRVVEKMRVSPMDCDWGMFVHPVLVLEHNEGNGQNRRNPVHPGNG